MTGILIVDKPADWTSQDVAAKLRGVFHERRVGHGGTLDPMATGVLPVFLGRATRAVQFAETGEKEYLAGLKLGLATNTQDIWGETVEQRPVNVTPGQVEELLPRFTGELQQIPPMYSAVKINGKKLYELARKGVEVERKPRQITIFSLKSEGWEDGILYLRVRCSRGTYIRTLCHDLGQELGCGGCMASLVRTEACSFPLAQAYPLQEVIDHPDPSSLLLPTDLLFRDKPSLTVNIQGAQRIRHGGELSYPKVADGEYRVYAPDGEFLMLGRLREGRLSCIKNFFEV